MRERGGDRARRRTPLAVGGLVILALVSASSPAAAATWQAVDTIGTSGLGASVETWEAVPVDFDGDGDEDVWVGHHDQGGKLWRNDGAGSYTRVAASAWPRVNAEGNIPDRHVCAWADVDQDGRVDAYCSAGRGGANAVKTGKDNELWLQRSPGRFTEVGTQWGVGEVCGRSHYVTFLHANDDVYPDLFVGNAPPRQVGGDPCDDSANGLPDEQSKLFLNQGGAGFTRALGLGISGNGGARCAEVTDFNQDGWDDLLVCGPPGNKLYRNNAGMGFTDVTALNRLNGRYSDADFGDLDGDGDMDLVTSVWGQFAYRLNTNGRFGAEVRIGSVPSGGGGRSLALGDADGDGDVDVYGQVANGPDGSNPRDTIYRNSGLAFSPVPVPTASGIGDAVTALDGDDDGVSEFLVLNGVEVTGPIQRIELLFR